MRHLIALIFLAALALPAQAQWLQTDVTAGLHIVFVECDTCEAFSISADTLTIFNAPRFFRMLDSIAADRGWGAGGGQTYLKDATNFAGSIDSTGRLYTLKYLVDGWAKWSASGTFSGDSVQVEFEGAVNIFNYGFYEVAGWSVETPGNTSGQKGFVALANTHPPLAQGDSAMMTVHLSKRSGTFYLGFFKHHMDDNWNPGITAGTMIFEQTLAAVFPTNPIFGYRITVYLKRRRP